MGEGYEALTDKERQTLRLLLVGHDAKSMARHFGLSVHTINERLRDARRKLSVSSSKEAARLLHEIEGADPRSVGNAPFGDAPVAPDDQHRSQPASAPRRRRWGRWAIGGLTMILISAMIAVSAPVPAPLRAPDAAATSPAPETDVTGAARAWLALVDDGKWPESWAATGRSFRSLNTVEAWQSASQHVRSSLGTVLSRTLMSEQHTPAPPNGYRTVRFRTDFTNRKGAIETLSLDRESDGWKVVGISIE